MPMRRVAGLGLTALAVGVLWSAPAVAARPVLSYVTGRNDFTGGHVVVEGKRLYVGNYGLGMRSGCSRATRRGGLSTTRATFMSAT